MNDCPNPAHADTGTTCRGCAEACERELTGLHDRYQRLLNDRSQWEDDTRAAIRRRALDDVRGFAHLYMRDLLHSQPANNAVEAALGRATILDPELGRTKAAREQIEQTRAAAAYAQKQIWESGGTGQAAGEAWVNEPAQAEANRLRDLIVATGQALHKEHGITFNGFDPCRCAGCTLIRAMDTVPDPAIPAERARLSGGGTDG